MIWHREDGGSSPRRSPGIRPYGMHGSCSRGRGHLIRWSRQTGEGAMTDHRVDIGPFGDARRAATGAFLLQRILETGSLVVRRIGRDRAGEIAVHRFLSAPAVQVQEIIHTVAARTAAACRARRIVAVQDTTEINVTGRDRARRGLGPNGNGSVGFFIHPVLAVDAGTEALLGV